MRICVIGAGIVGCAAALELRRRGFEVTVVERSGEAGHGTTSASCGIVRRFYSQPGMIAMAHESARIWADWTSYVGEVGEDLAVFHRPGMLFIPPGGDVSVAGIVGEMRKLGIAVHVWTADDVESRFPYLDTTSHHPPRPCSDPAFFAPTGRRIEVAVFEEDAGYVVSPGLATHNLRLAAEREGVLFLLNHEVLGITRTPAGSFVLATREKEAVEATMVVNAAGPHSAMVNEMAGVELPLATRALRREVHALANPCFDDGRGGDLPIVGDLDSGIYFRPEAQGRQLIVGTTDPACDELEWVSDPDDYRQTVTEEYWERHCLRLMKRFPEMQLGPRRGIASLYDVTVQDWYPIVDRTDVPGWFVCMGTSGSSFKTAPVLGQLVAELVAAQARGQDTDREAIELRLSRVGVAIDAGFLGRRRGHLRSTGTVIG